MNKYSLEIKTDALKFIQKQPKHIKERFLKWTENVILDPLKENDGIFINHFYNSQQVYKKRIGNIRILFVIIQNELKIFVIKIGNRGQVYKD